MTAQTYLTDTATLPALRLEPDSKWRKRLYPMTLVVLYTLWFAYMAFNGLWGLYGEHGAVTLTMIPGSLIAGATAEGGAAVAFPVFTKVLHIPPEQARTFGLMIQSVGMTMAALVIYAQRIPVLWRVIALVSGGGVIGQVIGTYFLILPNPYPRILFTVVAACFGTALLLSRFKLKHTPRQTLPIENRRQQLTFFLVGICGGAFAAHTGSGIDMLTFIVLTLAYGIHEKVSTPTTVVIMGLNSIVGFALHGLVSQDIGIVWEYWLVAVPVVVIGAPMGAMLAARLHRDVIIGVLAGLIALEVFTTLWLVPFNVQAQLVTLLVIAGCAFVFALMLHHRHRLYHRS